MNMPDTPNPPEGEQTTRYTVQCVNDGSHVCGPYDNPGDANREAKRLNKEATLGRTEPSEAYPHGQPLDVRGRTLKKDGALRNYEVVTETGVVVVN